MPPSDCSQLPCWRGPSFWQTRSPWHGRVAFSVRQLSPVWAAGVNPALPGFVFGEPSSSQKLDLYLPAATSSKLRVLVYIHGRGFAVGARTMASAAIVKAILDAGFAVASLDCRLSGEAPFPAAVQDVFQAVAYLKANAARWILDADRQVIYGESAGANLASMIGMVFSDPCSERVSVTDPCACGQPLSSPTIRPWISCAWTCSCASKDAKPRFRTMTTRKASNHGISAGRFSRLQRWPSAPIRRLLPRPACRHS